MDNCRDTDNSVGVGTGQQLHDGRVHSYPVGHCCYCCAAQPHSGASARVAGGKEYLFNQVNNRKERNKYKEKLKSLLDKWSAHFDRLSSRSKRLAQI